MFLVFFFVFCFFFGGFFCGVCAETEKIRALQAAFIDPDKIISMDRYWIGSYTPPQKKKEKNNQIPRKPKLNATQTA
jgi:hypothetical protein